MKLFFRISAPEKPIASRFCTGLLSLSLVLSASAEVIPGSGPVLTLSQAVSLTLQQHPEINAFVPRYRMQKGLVQQASVGKRPQVGLMIEDALGNGDHSALRSMQSTLTFTWMLQQKQIDSRIAAVKSQTGQLDVEQRVASLDLAAHTAKKFIQILIKDERLKLNRIALQQAQDVHSAISKRVDAGKSSNVEKLQAEAEQVRRELAIEDLEHELTASYYQLTSMWGEAGKAYQVSGNLLALPANPSVESQLDKLKNQPLLAKFATQRRIAQSQIEVARIEAKPQWQLSAGVRRYEATDDFGLVAGISIPWGNNNRNAGKIAALQAHQEVLADEASALLQKLDAQLYVLLQEMGHSRHVIDTIQQRIIPLLENALSDASSAFDIGKLNYTQWNNVRQELLTAKSRLLDAYESLHLQHIEIQRLTGSSISQ
ncbi:outer membrane efflux protein [Paraglaciecola mesophila KMM 241]|uniref:Outer membrane efflux protein n=1 Tax=Paraglaciecola mesophila KMM 241 TaxID=1128912 RepID=K6YRH4_9ALTE|nr:TolC family protein [Paraglaciecola mesophila]GAC26591.1 outer membrane efflux protein [Paraglaciecola mesophila KMM 241]